MCENWSPQNLSYSHIPENKSTQNFFQNCLLAEFQILNDGFPITFFFSKISACEENNTCWATGKISPRKLIEIYLSAKKIQGQIGPNLHLRK